ncbi:MAG: isoprenyl transferase [Oscillospiraceae bacterium]|nr:isoprenyl transferase [Oscillospiraceae bacterium]MDY4191052.1 isoprenyl transferase [Oscillospiraceae bacterium]
MKGEAMAVQEQENVSLPVIPRHIGIIMDGNGRWAVKRGLPRKAGHKAGAKAFERVSEYCEKIGVKYLTAYAFSTENWRRPPEEVEAIMDLLREYLKNAEERREKNSKVRMLFLGDRSALAPDLQEKMDRMERESANKTGITICMAINYGGRDEIAHAARELARLAKAGSLSPEEITPELLEKHLYTRGIPDPDFIIRPSGEQRISNFLLWQSAYSEFIYRDVLWPDFEPEDLRGAIEEFAGRSRRFGGI